MAQNECFYRLRSPWRTIGVAYRHGLRVSELVNLRWDQVNLDAAMLRIYRVKRQPTASLPDHNSRLALCF